LAFGAFIFAPVTFVVKGLEGLVAASIAHGQRGSAGSAGTLSIRKVVAVIAGAIVMVGGYFLAEGFVLGLLDPSFGLVAAAGELVPNLLQGGISAVVGYMLATIIEKLLVKNGNYGFRI
jgi:uncharacterized membrane protein